MENNYVFSTEQTFDRERYVVCQRTFINDVYKWMASGLAATGLVAWYIGMKNPDWIFAHHNLLLPLIVAELVLVSVISAGINKINHFTAGLLFAVYAVLNGLTLSVIFLVYDLGSIANVFFTTAGTFAVMSLYGYVTKRDLTGLGAMCMMGLFGLIIAGVINLFWKNSSFELITSIIGVGVFVGLTAYDTQKIKELAFRSEEGEFEVEFSRKYAILGALTLYLDFVNLFLYLLRLFGKRR